MCADRYWYSSFPWSVVLLRNKVGGGQQKLQGQILACLKGLQWSKAASHWQTKVAGSLLESIRIKWPGSQLLTKPLMMFSFAHQLIWSQLPVFLLYKTNSLFLLCSRIISRANTQVYAITNIWWFCCTDKSLD